MEVQQLMKLAIRHGGDGIKCVQGERPVVRVHGAYHVVDFQRLEKSHIEELVLRFIGKDHEKIPPEGLEFSVPPVSFDHYRYHARGSITMVEEGLCLSLKVMATNPPRLSSFGFGAVIEERLRSRSGLIVVGGPSNSGKTTTLGAIMVELAALGRSIDTLESPIEIGVPVRAFNKALVNQRRISADAVAYSSSWKSVEQRLSRPCE